MAKDIQLSLFRLCTLKEGLLGLKRVKDFVCVWSEESEKIA